MRSASVAVNLLSRRWQSLQSLAKLLPSRLRCAPQNAWKVSSTTLFSWKSQAAAAKDCQSCHEMLRSLSALGEVFLGEVCRGELFLGCFCTEPDLDGVSIGTGRRCCCLTGDVCVGRSAACCTCCGGGCCCCCCCPEDGLVLGKSLCKTSFSSETAGPANSPADGESARGLADRFRAERDGEESRRVRAAPGCSDLLRKGSIRFGEPPRPRGLVGEACASGGLPKGVLASPVTIGMANSPPVVMKGWLCGECAQVRLLSAKRAAVAEAVPDEGESQRGDSGCGFLGGECLRPSSGVGCCE
mmetsp:Transcript_65742/g.129546  ORF Transcript_65742/g.129546 Transcript_65742/m.129546 type:complete len:300 (-) Transcript_65742:630-1529(-)